MKYICYAIAGLLFVAALIAGLYVAIWLCLVGGIIQVVQACQETPINAVHLAYGIVRVLCTSLAGTITFFIGTGIASVFGFIGSLFED
jgi:dTDP-4-dehydrorhamnose reductase